MVEIFYGFIIENVWTHSSSANISPTLGVCFSNKSNLYQINKINTTDVANVYSDKYFTHNMYGIYLLNKMQMMSQMLSQVDGNVHSRGDSHYLGRYRNAAI